MSMQLLSTISSIVGLLGVVGPTLYFLFCFLYDVLEAPSLARTVQTEIAAGASLLGSIPTVCQSEDSLAQPRDIYPLIENLSDILRDRLHDLRRLTDQLCWDQNMPLRNRFEWAMKVRRIQFAREHIETPKTSLQMSLTILHERSLKKVIDLMNRLHDLLESSLQQDKHLAQPLATLEAVTTTATGDPAPFGRDRDIISDMAIVPHKLPAE